MKCHVATSQIAKILTLSFNARRIDRKKKRKRRQQAAETSTAARGVTATLVIAAVEAQIQHKILSKLGHLQLKPPFSPPETPTALNFAQSLF